MLKVYFNKYQFIEGETQGKVNDEEFALLADVKYIESTNNKIVIGDNEEDKKDWEIFSSNMKVFMKYFEDVLLERVEETKKADYADNTKLLEENFVIVQR